MPSKLPQGLSTQSALQRLSGDGTNELAISQRRTLLSISREVLREPMFFLLIIAGSIYFLVGEVQDAITLMAFVAIIITVTIFQERRTDHVLNTLRDLSSPRARVLRDGSIVHIAGKEVVRGDILFIAEGDRIAADGVVLQAHELATDESMLTGESDSVPKAMQDHVFASTLVVAGQGVVQVSATGHKTAMGGIGQSLAEIGLQDSPLRQEMLRLTKKFAISGLLLSLLLFFLFYLLRDDVFGAVLAAIGLAMALLPQEFPVIMIVVLALAARRLSVNQVLTRRLKAIETLGQTTILCVDKTGTLTYNRMQVAAMAIGDQLYELQISNNTTLSPDCDALLASAVLASETEPHDPMEKALHQLASHQTATTDYFHPQWELVREYELSPVLMAMTHLWRRDEGHDDVAACKGAPEAVAALCRLPETEIQHVAQMAARMAERGLRVLGVASAVHQSGTPWPATQQEFHFRWLGLIGLTDPLRAEVPDTVRQCNRAGIRVVMITGDHPKTAAAIAAQAGIAAAGMLTGSDLDNISREALSAQLADVHVFARIRPEQKLALVELFKSRGEIVAMTGDGINDAPALKAAHIGIAMGQRGTDVAREAASLVLLKDDFSSIMQAIKMGRRTFANMRQAMLYTLAVHVPIAGLALLPVLFGLPLILAPLHIAFIELLINPICSLVFEAEQPANNVMEQPPRRLGEPLLPSLKMAESLLYGTILTVAIFGLYAWLLADGMPAAKAAAATFIVLITADAMLILPSRSAQITWRSLWADMPAISIAALIATFVALLMITRLSWISEAFRFGHLSYPEWFMYLGIGISLLLVLQITKMLIGSNGKDAISLQQ